MTLTEWGTIIGILVVHSGFVRRTHDNVPR